MRGEQGADRILSFGVVPRLTSHVGQKPYSPKCLMMHTLQTAGATAAVRKAHGADFSSKQRIYPLSHILLSRQPCQILHRGKAKEEGKGPTCVQAFSHSLRVAEIPHAERADQVLVHDLCWKHYIAPFQLGPLFPIFRHFIIKF